MPVTIPEPDSIKGLADQAVLRNLVITQGYHELSDGFAEVLGRENVSWCTFASWSSKLVGKFLQSEEMPTVIARTVEGSWGKTNRMEVLNKRLKSIHSDTHISLMHAIRSTVNDMRMYLGMGNTLVFAELSPLFAGFIDTFRGATSPDEAKLKKFLEPLRPGRATPDGVLLNHETKELELTSLGGQEFLRDALTHYHEAIFEKDPNKKAELVLLANALVGLHEQTRLQTYIAGSLNSPIRAVLQSSAHDSLAELAIEKLLGDRAHKLLDRLLAPIADKLEETFHAFATQEMMSLKLPDGDLRLGVDVPSPPGEPLFPKDLEKIENQELQDILDQYGTLMPDEHGLVQELQHKFSKLLGEAGFLAPRVTGTAASDWVKLSNRMRFILELFRSRAQDDTLLQPVFSEEQVRLINDRKIPPGPLF